MARTAPDDRKEAIPIHRALAVALALALAAAPAARAAPAMPTYALVVKDAGNPYMQKLYEGFAAACDALGAAPRLAGPGIMDAGAQAGVIGALVDEGVDGIAVAVSDEAAAAGPLRRALDAGISVVSVDSAADPGCRQVHIQQADPNVIGRALMQAARRMIGGEGEAAILSTTESMPNQATWVRLMLDEVSGHPDEYRDMPIVEVAYGQDDEAASAREAGRLLDEHSDLSIIIAPTVVGLQAAAGVVEARGSGALVTGLGLPSGMAPYIQSGTCPWMYLWNPIDMGYLAAYALDALARGESTGAVGEALTAGRIGERIVTRALDGGTEIVAGNPCKFDKGNILSWKNAF